VNALPARFSTVFATLTVSLANASVVYLALAELSLANTTKHTKNKHTKSMMTVLCFRRNHLPVCGKSNPRPRKDFTELIALSTCDNESLLRMPMTD